MLRLHHGGELEGVRVAWRLAGQPRAPVVAALGGISAHRIVYSHGDARGWWDGIVGPGRALDATRFRVLGIDFLGGSGATTGPRVGEPFPSVSSYDQAELLLRLLNHLGIARLHAIAGASYGGMVALAFGERFAQRVERLLVISASDRTHPMATAWRSVQRRLVRYALSHGEGARGLELARALAMATYRSPEEFAARFRAAPERLGDRFEFPVEHYLFARGATTPRNTGPRPSSACRSRSTCTASTPRASASRRRSSACARTSSCRSPTCGRCARVCRTRTPGRDLVHLRPRRLPEGSRATGAGLPPLPGEFP